MACSDTLTLLGNDPLVNDTRNTFLINLNIVSCCFYSLNIYEYQ